MAGVKPVSAMRRRGNVADRAEENRKRMAALVGPGFVQASVVGDQLEGIAPAAETEPAAALAAVAGEAEVAEEVAAAAPAAAATPARKRVPAGETWEKVGVALRKEEWRMLNEVAFKRFWKAEKSAKRPSRREHSLAVLLREAIEKYEFPAQGPALKTALKEGEWIGERMIFGIRRPQWLRLRKVHESRCLAGGRRRANALGSLIREAVLGYDWGVGTHGKRAPASTSSVESVSAPTSAADEGAIERAGIEGRSEDPSAASE
jgi:hypothetical protein